MIGENYIEPTCIGAYVARIQAMQACIFFGCRTIFTRFFGFTLD